ncbi:polyprenal reductase-like [Oculina patagonica]
MDVLLAGLIFLNFVCFLIIMLYIMESYIPEWLYDLFEWGKTKHDSKQANWTQYLHVPNSWFTHFYVVGSSLSCALLLMLINHCFFNNTSITDSFAQLLDLNYTPRVDCFTVLVSLLLLLAQAGRRLFECLFISVFTGRIHISHYLVGIFFYVFDATAMAASFLSVQKIDKDWCSSCIHSLNAFRWYQCFGVVVLLWASWHQWNCHNILAKLRHSANEQTIKVYRIPYGDWFHYVSSPHYLAEILIYFSFFLIQKGQNIYIGLILLFTIQNLSLGATVTQKWYNRKFKEYPQNRCRIFPFLY